MTVPWMRAQRIVVAESANSYALDHVEEVLQGVGLRLTRSQLSEIARASE